MRPPSARELRSCLADPDERALQAAGLDLPVEQVAIAKWTGTEDNPRQSITIVPEAAYQAEVPPFIDAGSIACRRWSDRANKEQPTAQAAPTHQPASTSLGQ